MLHFMWQHSYYHIASKLSFEFIFEAHPVVLEIHLVEH